MFAAITNKHFVHPRNAFTPHVGQSNMELPMQHALTRNRSYYALDTLGMYANIRTFKNGVHTATFDGDELYVTPPPPPPSGSYYGTCPTVRALVTVEPLLYLAMQCALFVC